MQPFFLAIDMLLGISLKIVSLTKKIRLRMSIIINHNFVLLEKKKQISFFYFLFPNFPAIYLRVILSPLRAWTNSYPCALLSKINLFLPKWISLMCEERVKVILLKKENSNFDKFLLFQKCSMSVQKLFDW